MRGRNSERGQAHDGFVHLARCLSEGPGSSRLQRGRNRFSPDLGLTGFL